MLVLLKDIISAQIAHHTVTQDHTTFQVQLVWLKTQGIGQRIESDANYVVIRTKYDGEATVFSAGFYRDAIVRTEHGLKFESRLCVYDTEMIANSVIYPI